MQRSYFSVVSGMYVLLLGDCIICSVTIYLEAYLVVVNLFDHDKPYHHKQDET